MSAPWIRYTPEERAFIKANRKLTRRALHREFCTLFKREDVSLDNIKALCTRRGWKGGNNGCFKKGSVPANKGKKMPYNANTARTQFKKGNVPPNVKYAGHERVSKDGYVEISVNERNPHTGYERRYVHKHKWLWEKKHGKVPEGMCLKSLDGNKENTDPSNWELMDRGMLPRLNGIYGRGYDRAPAELKPTILAVAKLEDKTCKRRANNR